jgi:hypothetical protein
MLTDVEIDAVVARCREVPLTTNVYLAHDFVSALLETVIDYQMPSKAVRNAIDHFARERSHDIRTMDDLQACLAQYPDTNEGNVELARYLWGYRLWTRAKQLRDLAIYFDRLGISTLDGLREWARTTTFKDFAGQVKGLGPAVYQWLVMRLGTETVKPDVHVLRFVSGAVGRPVGELDAIRVLEEAAKRLGVKASVLDWSIWEYSRGSSP